MCEKQANLTVMALLNLNHLLIITQAELRLKCTFVKQVSCLLPVFRYIKTLGEKTFFTCPVPSILK